MRTGWLRPWTALALTVALLGAAGAGASAQTTVAARPAAAAPTTDLAPDPEVLFGRLPNGLRYAIRHNDTPPGQVVMRFQIMAGSMHERPDQLGYAHFIEHMAFRGSTHLADGDYARRLSALGAGFGADVNAFTNALSTTYHINLPRNDAESLDTGFMLMREVASEVRIKPEVFDAERGVILAEERTGASVGRRAGYAANAFIYDGHPFARPVVGAVDSIKSADAEGVQRFYEAYYRPERALLVIVGDVDPKAVEGRIRAAFGDWRGKGEAGLDPAPVKALAAGDPHQFTYTEPGLAPAIRLIWRSPAPSGPDTHARQVERMRDGIAISVLQYRLTDATQVDNAPFRRASVGVQSFPGVSSEIYLDVNTLTNWKSAMMALYGRWRSVVEAPVEQVELDRAIGQRRAALMEAEARAVTRPDLELAQALLNDIDNERVFLSPAQRRALFDEAVKGLTPADINGNLKARLGAQKPLVVLTSPAPIPGGGEAVRGQIALAEAAPVTQVAAVEMKAWPFTSFGEAGKVAERRDVGGGVTLVRFENGVRLTVKPTKFRADEILVNVRFGNGSMGWSRTRVEPERALWLPLLSDGGLEGVSTRDRSLYLTGKVVSLSISVADDAFVLSGATREADLDTQMQLFAADLTAAAWRPESFEALKRQEVGMLMGRGPPVQAFRSKEASILRSDDPRWTSPTAFQVNSLTYDKVKAFGQGVLARGPMEVIVVGDVTPERAIQAVASTLGALPPRAPVDLPDDARDVRFPAATPDPVTLYHSGRLDQGLAVTAWPTSDYWKDPQGAVTVEILREVVRQRLLAQLRATMSQTYSPSVTSLASTALPGYGVLAARVETPPDKMDQAFAAIDGIADDLVAKEIGAEEFARAANPYIESLNRVMQTNTYWLGWLQGAADHPDRIETAAQATARARAVTTADVHAAAERYLPKTRAWRGKIVPDPALTPRPPPQAVNSPRGERAEAARP